ncbi:hypothetical protein B7463_g4596, partial [Scytalidium lignicola]
MRLAEAATIPLSAMTAAIHLYQVLHLPLPWAPATEATPLLIYGGASAVGAYAIKLAKLSNIYPLIVVAGRGIPFVENLIDRSQGDTVLDYRNGDDKIVGDLRDALGGRKLEYALDAVSEKNSYVNIDKVIEATGQVSLVLSAKEKVMPSGLKLVFRSVGTVHGPVAKDTRDGKHRAKIGDVQFGGVFFRFFAQGLRERWFTGHPYEVVPGGLRGLQVALKNLKEGRASAVKYIARLEDTEGLWPNPPLGAT